MWLDSIDRQGEYAIFRTCDEEGFHCDQTENSWGFGDFTGATELGEHGERLAKFWTPQNATDDWHGHPVKKDSGRPNANLPGKELILRWISGNFVSKEFGLKLLRGDV
ncbi:MAG: hypothetical protein JST89_14055 [Cyanobacteria bacterium SZAS-4]|nr:hypothetical protein [Cyanobacteria bacterium SZAS-4]